MNRKPSDPSTGIIKRREEVDDHELISAERRILDVRKAAHFLGVSESIIRRLIKERRIPFFQIEGRYLFYRPELERWIEDQIVHPVSTTSSGLAADAASGIWKHSQGGKSWP